MNATLYQMAVITQMTTEYDEVLRGYFPNTNIRAIKSAYEATSKSNQEASIPDGRYITSKGGAA